MNAWMKCAVAAFALAACGRTDSLEKEPLPEELGTAVGELTKQTLTPAIESDHPYQNSVVQTWKVKTPECATFFRIHFETIDVEEGYDFVRLVDKDGNKVKSYTGFFRGWSPQLPGTEATLELVTDRANTGYGFKVDAIEYTGDEGTGTWTTTMFAAADVVSTPHPYANGTAQNFTVKGPPGALKMRLHFKNFETEARYDIVSLFTDDMQQMATYTGNLADFVSAEVPGDTVVVRLSADYSVPGYGFDIVGYEALMPGGPGTCAQPVGCLMVAPAQHDFGNVQVGCEASKELVVTNTCASSVRFYKPQMRRGGGEFSITQSPAAAMDLAAGASVSVFVKYAPSDLGADKAELALEAVEAGTNVKYPVSLEGVGDQAGANHDEFVQQSSGKADILFVIDNSCSMTPYQQALAQNFASFISYAQTTGVDYHLAVTTTDTDTRGEQGRFVTGPTHPETVLSATTTDLTAKFAAKVNVGTRGSATERCFDASYRALTEPLLSGHNAGFVRRDASLAVVCVSDELEQSANDPSFYANALYNLKGGDANQVTYNVVALFSPPPSSCKTSSSFLDDGRYADLVSLTKGVTGDICAADWASSLQAVGKASAGFRTDFVLTSKPSATAGVVVKVDGQVVPAVNAAGDTVWTVDPATQTLSFAPAFAPKPGEKVSVDYAVACN